MKLTLEKYNSGGKINLRVDGVSAGYLIQFNNNGQVERHGSINPTLGFKLDNQGRIVINEEGNQNGN